MPLRGGDREMSPPLCLKFRKSPTLLLDVHSSFVLPQTQNWVPPFPYVTPTSPLIMDHILEKVTKISKILPIACIFSSIIITYLKSLAGLNPLKDSYTFKNTLITYLPKIICPALYPVFCQKCPPVNLLYPNEGVVPSPWPLVGNSEFLLWNDWTLYLHKQSGIDKFCSKSCSFVNFLYRLNWNMLTSIVTPNLIN